MLPPKERRKKIPIKSTNGATSQFRTGSSGNIISLFNSLTYLRVQSNNDKTKPPVEFFFNVLITCKRRYTPNQRQRDFISAKYTPLKCYKIKCQTDCNAGK